MYNVTGAEAWASGAGGRGAWAPAAKSRIGTGRESQRSVGTPVIYGNCRFSACCHILKAHGECFSPENFPVEGVGISWRILAVF